MAYTFFGNEPNPLVCCDILSCPVESDDLQINIIKLNCGHTFHNGCLPKKSQHATVAHDHIYARPDCDHCPICMEPFEKRVKELSKSFNDYLLGQSNEETANENDDGDEGADDEEEENDEGENEEDFNNIKTEFQRKVISLREQLNDKMDKLEAKQIRPGWASKITLLSSQQKSSQSAPTAVTDQPHPTNTPLSSGFKCTFQGCERVCLSKGGLQNHRRIHKK